MNIKCIRYGFKSLKWEIENVLKLVIFYSMLFFVSIVIWYSCMI